MASKWAFLTATDDEGRRKYPKLELESDYQAKINVVKDKFRDRLAAGDDPTPELKLDSHFETALDYLPPHVGLHAKYIALFEAALDAKEAAEEALSKANLELAATEQALQVSAEAAGVAEGFKSERYTYFPQPSPYPKVADKAALVAWVKKSGQEELLSLNYQTLKGMVSEALGPNGSREIPDGVEVFVKESISRRKR